MSASFLYITAPNRDDALRIGRTLVEERLVACVNVLDGMRSVYRWQGKVEEAQEAVLIAKTRSELVEQVTARVQELHTYDCPCVVSWNLEAGNPAYLDWIRDETNSG